MVVLLEETCRSLPHGGDHEVRAFIAQRLAEIRCRRAVDNWPPWHRRTKGSGGLSCHSLNAGQPDKRVDAGGRRPEYFRVPGKPRRRLATGPPHDETQRDRRLWLSPRARVMNSGSRKRPLAIRDRRRVVDGGHRPLDSLNTIARLAFQSISAFCLHGFAVRLARCGPAGFDPPPRNVPASSRGKPLLRGNPYQPATSSFAE